MNKLRQNVPNRKSSLQVFRSPEWLRKFAILNRRKAQFRLLILFILTAFFCLQLPKLRFEYDFDSFFPEGDEDLAYYESLNAEFGEFNDFLFIVLKTENPKDARFLEQAHTTLESIKNWEAVAGVENPFDAKRIQITPLGVNSISLIEPQKDIKLDSLSDNFLLGKFFGKDQQSMLYILRHEAFDNKRMADAFFIKLRDYLMEMFDQEYLISGKIQMQYDFTQKLEKELFRMLIIASAFVILVLLILFRSLKGILIPLLTLVVSLIWTMGFVALLGKPLDVMMVIVPSILLIVSLSDVIHFIHKYDELRNRGLNTADALHKSIRFIGKATFLTSLTTAIGFLSLYILPIKPIQDFGFYTASGVLFAFVITFLLVPSLLFIFSRPVEGKGTLRLSWQKGMNHLFIGLMRKRRWVLTGVCLMSFGLMIGALNLRLNTSIIVGFQKGEPELEQVSYFDQVFGGYKPFEIGIEIVEDKDLTDLEVMHEIAKIEEFVKRQYDVDYVESPLNLIKSINSGLHGGSDNYFKLPEKKTLARLKRHYYSPRLKYVREVFQNTHRARLIGRSRDVGSSKARELNEALNSFLSSEIDSNLVSARLTGTSFLIDKTDNYIVKALIKGLGAAALSISVFLFIFFQRWQVMLFSLIPNLLPIFILFGLMGWLGIDLNISTAVVFTVAFGIAVDDSIHLIARYYLEKRDFKSPLWALKRSYSGTGKSIIVTSLVILAGFSLFMTSGLSSPYYLGFFIVMTALIAVILDMTLLPLLILRYARRN